MTQKCSACAMRSPVTDPKFCVCCGSPFVPEPPPEPRKPKTSANQTASPAAAAVAGKGAPAAGSAGGASIASSSWWPSRRTVRRWRNAVVISALVSLALGSAGLYLLSHRAVSSQASRIVEQPGLVAPESGLYEHREKYWLSRLNVAVNGQQARFAASISEDGQQRCALSGVARIDGKGLKYGPDAQNCSVVIWFHERASGRAATVETYSCQNICSGNASLLEDIYFKD